MKRIDLRDRLKLSKKLILLCVAVLFMPFSLLAEEERIADRLEKGLIQDNIKLSKLFDSVAEGLDLFLVGKKVTNKKNDTRVKVENSTFYTEGGGIANSAGIGVNLRLPNFEEYWRLKFTSYDEQEEDRGVKKGAFRQAPRETNYGASVGFFRKLGDVRSSFEPRIDLQDPLKVSHSLTFQSVAKMRDFKVNPKLEFFASPTKGVGNFLAFNFNFDLSKYYTLTLINEGEYLDKDHTFEVGNGFSIGQILTEATSLSYNFLIDSINRPSYHLDGYSFSVQWNHVLYKKMLDYSVSPRIDFTKSRNFRGLSGLGVGISLNF